MSTEAVIYCRVSTREQGESGLGLKAQEDAARKVCEQKGWTVARVVREVVSGGARHRPLFDEACDYCRENGAIMVGRSDRISRGGPMSVLPLYERAANEGWNIFALDFPDIDPTSIMGELVITVISGVNRMVRRSISENTRSALARAKIEGTKSGKPIGRPRAGDDADPAVRQRLERALHGIRVLRDEGLSFKAIAERLNEKGVPSPHNGRWHERTTRAAFKTYIENNDSEKEKAA